MSIAHNILARQGRTVNMTLQGKQESGNTKKWPTQDILIHTGEGATGNGRALASYIVTSLVHRQSVRSKHMKHPCNG